MARALFLDPKFFNEKLANNSQFISSLVTGLWLPDDGHLTARHVRHMFAWKFQVETDDLWKI